jgi:hypothetical protein
MPITLINNIFSKDDIDHINKTISDSGFKISLNLGRRRTKDNLKDTLSPKIIDKFYDIVKNITDTPLTMTGVMSVEYSCLYGRPNLPPHFDGDSNEIIINMQVSSNTSWDIGLNLEVYSMEDNSALIFNPNKEIHWRTHKEFKEGEYVRMLFVRFCNLEEIKDNSELFNLSKDDPIFKDIIDLRDQLSTDKYTQNC